jgi:uncharacterized membrane protein YfcA
MAIPGIIAGYFGGTRLQGRMSPVFFRRLALVVITISGAFALFSD